MRGLKEMAFNKFQYEKLRAKRHANKVKWKNEIRQIRHSNDPERKMPTCGKIFAGFVFADCFFIQCFIMFMMYTMKDMSQIGSLIGLVGTLFVQGVALMSYNSKSAKENTVGGIVYQNMIQTFAGNSVNQMADISSDSDDAVG